jgi:hypothetical protein
VTRCRHPELVLPRSRPRLQCRRCGLTLTAEELGAGPCPECLEDRGERRREFEPLPGVPPGDRGYRCAACGTRIDWG